MSIWKSPGSKAALLAFLPLLVALGAWSRLPAQDAAGYFAFVDQRQVFGIPNFGDVVSNLAFLAVGLLIVKSASRAGVLGRLVTALGVSLILTAFGSAYFHWSPDAATLFWDRLPMVLLFSSLIGLLIADRLNVRAGERTAVVLAILSSAHLVLWTLNVMDLRPYFVFQAGAFVWLILFNLSFAGERISRGHVWGMLGLYFVAKALEVQDSGVFEALHWVSGHTLKHLIAAGAVLCLVSGFSMAPHQNKSLKNRL